MDFIDDFITEYKNNPCLWKADSVYFKNRSKRQEAYMRLIEVAAKHGEHYNIERTKQKINNLRCAFRHQLKKYIEMKNKGEKDDLFSPKRRYFESLMFLKDEESSDKNSKNVNYQKSQENTEIAKTSICLETENTSDHIAAKPHIINLINGSKINTGEFSIEESNVDENYQKNITNSIEQSMYNEKYISTMGSRDSSFNSDKGVSNSQLIAEKEPASKKKTEKRKRTLSISSHLANEPELINNKICKVDSLSIDVEKLFSLACRSIQDKDDNFLNFGKIVAYRLRKMEPTQAILAEKIITDVLFQGQMNYLSTSSVNYFCKVQDTFNP